MHTTSIWRVRRFGCGHFAWKALVVLIGLVGSLSNAAADEAEDAKEAWQRQRRTAEKHLELVQGMTQKAREAAKEAKAELDAFVAEHFQEQMQRADGPLPKFNSAKPKRKATINPEWEQLARQVTAHKTKREELLTRLTPEHPEVVELDGQIAQLTKKLEKQRPLEDDDDGDQGEVAAEDPGEYLNTQRRRDLEASLSYEKLRARWETAQRDLEIAEAAEHRAEDRLAEIKPPLAIPAPPTANAGTSKLTVEVVAEPEGESSTSDGAHSETAEAAAAVPKKGATEASQQASQPMALAVLLIALAVAALAAVKLARSSSDAAFSSASEVSATLALPVVGVVPAVEVPGHRGFFGRYLRGGVTLLLQMMLAFIVFALVALAVQDPGGLWRMCSHPGDGLGEMTRFFEAR